MSTLPLTALRAFDKVAEHLSFTGAAEALHVTQSAVSQQVAQLEERLGKRLIERHGRTLRLTSQGELLAVACQRSFSALERALQQVSKGRGQGLRLKLPPTFAMKWLMPRLPEFQVLYPQLELHLSASVQPANFEAEDIDIGLQRSAEPDSGLYGLAVMDETGILVSSPELWGQRKPRVSELRSLTFLSSANRPDDWPLWLKGMGASELVPANQIAFGFSLLMYQAALEGLGVCIAQPEFVENELTTGRLIAPFRHTIATGRRHFIVCPTSSRHDPVVAQFFSWLQSVVRK